MQSAFGRDRPQSGVDTNAAPDVRLVAKALPVGNGEGERREVHSETGVQVLVKPEDLADPNSALRLRLRVRRRLRGTVAPLAHVLVKLLAILCHPKALQEGAEL